MYNNHLNIYYIMVKTRKRLSHNGCKKAGSQNNDYSENSFEEKIDLDHHIYPPIFVERNQPNDLFSNEYCYGQPKQNFNNELDMNVPEETKFHPDCRNPFQFSERCVLDSVVQCDQQNCGECKQLEQNKDNLVTFPFGEQSRSGADLVTWNQNPEEQLNNSINPAFVSIPRLYPPANFLAADQIQNNNSHITDKEIIYFEDDTTDGGPNAEQDQGNNSVKRVQFKPDFLYDQFIFGQINIKKMDIIFQGPAVQSNSVQNQNVSAGLRKYPLKPVCHPPQFNIAIQIEYNDFLYPITVVDQHGKTNCEIPFLYSVDSFLFQLQKKNKTFLIAQFFYENCCFNLSFRIYDVCIIKNYQVTLFAQTLCHSKDLEKLFHNNRCQNKVSVHCIFSSFYIQCGKMTFPKNVKCLNRR